MREKEGETAEREREREHVDQFEHKQAAVHFNHRAVITTVCTESETPIVKDRNGHETINSLILYGGKTDTGHCGPESVMLF